MKKIVFLGVILFSLSAAVKTFAQQVSVSLGADQIPINRAFTITITLQNAQLKSYSGFPDLPGFVKRGTSRSSSTNFINGTRSSTESITQNYAPTAEGKYSLDDFVIEVNGQKFQVQGKVIEVTPPKTQQKDPFGFDPFGNDPFGNFFSRPNATPKEFVDVKADAFLALTTSQSAVYVGEGVTVNLSFYVAMKDQQLIDFHELSQQYPEIIKKIKPTNCWEENFSIEQIEGEAIDIGGKSYVQYKLYEAAYYPLNLEAMKFPRLGLEMVKYKVAKNPTFFGRNKQEELKTYYTKPKQVKVLPLPPHPLKESVPVGHYTLKEKISSPQLQTGESFDYSFDIVGEGNISAISEPIVKKEKRLDLYPPNVRQKIYRANGVVSGRKSFGYYGIPNEPGSYRLKDYFQWIYFNVARKKYDTLQSDLVLRVTGESKKNEYILANDMGDFYDTVLAQDNTLKPIDARDRIRTAVNAAIFFIIATAAVVGLWFIKRK